eukprot:10095244-Alexandrium_andersonii.AAC.1
MSLAARKHVRPVPVPSTGLPAVCAGAVCLLQIMRTWRPPRPVILRAGRTHCSAPRPSGELCPIRNAAFSQGVCT